MSITVYTSMYRWRDFVMLANINKKVNVHFIQQTVYTVIRDIQQFLIKNILKKIVYVKRNWKYNFKTVKSGIVRSVDSSYSSNLSKIKIKTNLYE